MSVFFRALERAERERAQRDGHADTEGQAAPGRVPSAAADERPGDTPDSAREGRRPGSGPGVLRPETVAVAGPAGEERTQWDGTAPIDPVLVSLLEPSSVAAEQYRALRHVVEVLRLSASVRVMAITSPGVGDGKTVTAVNLAATLAQAADTRVLLIEADLRRPSFGDYLGLAGRRGRSGFADLIVDGRRTLLDSVLLYPPFNLAVLPAGHTSVAPYEILKSPRLERILTEARAAYDYVILDTPPLLPVSDCRILERWVDGFLVVVAANRTPRKAVEDALRTLGSKRVLAVVFNEDDDPGTRYYRPYIDPAAGFAGRRWWRPGRVRRRRADGAADAGR